MKVFKVRTADLERNKMLQTCSNVRSGEAAPQRVGPTRTLGLGRSCDFAKYTFCALLPLVWRMAKVGYPPFLLQTPSMLRCAPMS